MASEDLATLRARLSSAEEELDRATATVRTLREAIQKHPETQEAARAEATAQVSSLVERMREGLIKAGFTGLERLLDAVREGFDVAPRTTKFPVRLETKHYMPDAERAGTVIFYRWRGEPVFWAEVEFDGIWSGESDKLYYTFTRGAAEYEYDEVQSIPADVRAFLPEKQTELTFDLFLRGDGEKDLSDMEPTATTFLELLVASDEETYEDNALERAAAAVPKFSGEVA
jgi:hypothetical protein